MYKALDIARYIIERCNNMNLAINNFKLQKILYFIQAEFLVSKNEPCFIEEIQAWDFGPVVPTVYYAYRMFGGSNIPCVIKFRTAQMISLKDKKLLNNVIDECAKYSTSTLTEITYNQTPWISVYRSGQNNEIPKESIKKYFKEEEK